MIFRNILIDLSAKSIIISLTSLVLTNPVDAQKPNILWITIEDTSPQFIGCYENEAARTPTIDRIANEGIRFVNAFSNGTVCSPSRSAIITGCRTNMTGTGHHRSYYPIPEYIRGFPTYLREAGYYTSNNRKTDYNTSEEKRIIHESWDECSRKAGWQNRKPGQAFFAVFNYMDSHQSRTMTNPWDVYSKQVLQHLNEEELIDSEDFSMPPFLKDSPEMRKEHSRIYNALSLTDKKIDLLLADLKADGLMDSTIIFFYGDHGEGMPRGKTNSIGLGYRVPWAIWFPDMYRHLSPWGKGVVTEELASFVDLAPTILSLAGIEIPDYMSGRPLLGEQRIESDDFLYLSRDRISINTDLERSVSNGRYIYTRVYMPFMPEHRWMKYSDYAEIKRIMINDYRAGELNTVQQKTFQSRSVEYLYDLEKDPWEIHNLADDLAYKNLLNKFRNALDKKLRSIRDIHFLPEYDLERISRETTAYDFRLDRNKYPFDDIFEAASLSGMGEEVLEKQVNLLNSSIAQVRYWAAVGLTSQSCGLDKYRDKLLDELNDKYPPARIIIAGICYNEFDDQVAKDYLMKTCLNENPLLGSMAMQTIMYLDREKTITFLPMIHEIYSDYENKKGFEQIRDASEVLLYILEGQELFYDHFW